MHNVLLIDYIVTYFSIHLFVLKFHPVASNGFYFALSAGSHTCDIVEEAFKRYGLLIAKRGSYLKLKYG